MPTVITHAVVGAAAAGSWGRTGWKIKFLLLSVICPLLPDLDVIGFSLGIKYGDFLGHRGFFHSIFFAFIVGLFVASVFFRDQKLFSAGWWRLAGYFVLLISTHGLLDAFTSGGLGIALLSPVENTRYFFPWTPIKVSPINVKEFLNHRSYAILKSEALWVWLPAAVFVLMVNIFRLFRKRTD